MPLSPSDITRICCLYLPTDFYAVPPLLVFDTVTFWSCFFSTITIICLLISKIRLLSLPLMILNRCLTMSPKLNYTNVFGFFTIVHTRLSMVRWLHVLQPSRAHPPRGRSSWIPTSYRCCKFLANSRKFLLSGRYCPSFWLRSWTFQNLFEVFNSTQSIPVRLLKITFLWRKRHALSIPCSSFGDCSFSVCWSSYLFWACRAWPTS